METEKAEAFKQKSSDGMFRGMAFGELATVLWLGVFFVAIIAFTIWIIISLLQTV
jgi:hypothetical protein